MATLIGLALTIVNIIALWKLFEKAGEESWKAVIPIYNGYIVSKIGKCTKMFWIELTLGMVTMVIFIVCSVYIICEAMLLLPMSEYSAILVMIALLFVLCLLIAILVLQGIINVKFVSCYTDESVIKVLAAVGTIIPIAYTITVSILGFSLAKKKD